MYSRPLVGEYIYVASEKPKWIVVSTEMHDALHMHLACERASENSDEKKLIKQPKKCPS